MTSQAEYHHPEGRRSPGQKMMLLKSLKLNLSESSKDMAPEDNTLSSGRIIDQKVVPVFLKKTWNMPHVFYNNGGSSNKAPLL